MSVLRPHSSPTIGLERLVADFGLAVHGVDSAAGASQITPDISSCQISGITLDSESVVAGDLFVALPGSVQHGARFAAAAVAHGAVAVLTDEPGASLAGSLSVPVLVADKPRTILGPLAASVYGNPSAAMDLVGVTGTNGKTTTTYLLEAVLAAAGHQTALLGTIDTRIVGRSIPQARTTPEAPELQAILATAREAGVTAAAMEVSSHALSFGRVAGTKFRAAVFTNLSQDHLDFHGSMDSYFAAKFSMFRADMAEIAVICVDDEWGERVMERTHLPHVTYSATGITWADWQVSNVDLAIDGSRFRAHGPAGELIDVHLALPGAFNVANALGALATGVALGVDPAVASAGLESVAGVPGRLERIEEGQEFAAFVDFAHTPGAVRSLLATLRSLTAGRLLVVLGCGGDRDTGKRPAMARAAAEIADLAIFTSDNPRSEDPADIVIAMTAGLDLPYLVELDRRSAISLAVQGLGRGDTLVVAGKGHETGQEIAGVVTPFDDREVLRTAIRAIDASDVHP